MKSLIYFSVGLLSIFFLILFSLLKKIISVRPSKIIFGTTGILNNKYWSNALKEIELESETLMRKYYSNINAKDDFDLYFDDLIPIFLRKKYIKEIAYFFFVWLYIIKNARVFVMSFDGIIFNRFFWKIECLLFKLNHIKIIMIPYGSDAYMYSRIKDKCLQNALLASYPEAVKKEELVTKKVFFWSKHADIVLNGMMGCDGMPRWDSPICQLISIDTKQWSQKIQYSYNDGKNGVVKILHTPNHTGFKGTEYLLKAVQYLKEEGLQIELILLQKVPNSKVREWMQEVDILAEQFIFIGYALSGIEGMASGLPVIANLDNQEYTTLFRRYSYLNECPILSTTPETLKENLHLLVTNPDLRKELGMLGRQYAEKYHSYAASQYIFTSILKKLDGEQIDLMNLLHPLKSEYVQKNYIKTPLINNHFSKKLK